MSERTRFDAGERAAARLPVGAASGDTLLPGERWADAWRAELAAVSDVARARWEALLVVAGRATRPRATAEWRAAGVEAVQAVGVDALRAAASATVARLSGADSSSLDDGVERRVVADGNANVLRGLVWLLMLEPWRALPELLGALCTTCMVPVAGVGPRAQNVANACIASLGALAASTDVGLRAGAVTHLARARAIISDRATRVAISTAIASAAAALGLAADELEELAGVEQSAEDAESTLAAACVRSEASVRLGAPGKAVLKRDDRALEPASDFDRVPLVVATSVVPPLGKLPQEE